MWVQLKQLLSLYVLVSVLHVGVAIADSEDRETEFSSDVLIYSDTDRVMVVSPQVGIRHAIDEDGGEISARVVVDAITAASVDVISNATYRFSEVRSEVGLSASHAIGKSLPGLSYRGSYEPDYVSHGLTGSWQRELADGDANFSTSYSLVLDTISRSGTPTDVFSEKLRTHVLNLGGTQILDSKTLLRLVYTFTGQFGYMEKPYRSVPLFDAAGLASGKMAGLSLSNFDRFRLSIKPAEEVPDSRYRHAIAARGIRYLESWKSSLRLDYRFYIDSWGILANTVESALYRDFGESLRLYGWTRFHQQTSASFWEKTYLVSSSGEIPALRTSDRSLSSSYHLTGGLRAEYDGDAVDTYMEFSSMYSSFNDFLYLDSRIALIFQGGVRWAF